MRWFIILLEFDFTVVVKKDKMHQRADHLSRLMHGEAANGIDDDIPDAYLFNIEMVPRWSSSFEPILSIGLHNVQSLSVKQLIHDFASFVLLAERLYKHGRDGILRLCIEPSEKIHYLAMAYVALGQIHMSTNQTLRRVEWLGMWCPTIKTDIHEYVQQCAYCKNNKPIPHTTLFYV